jgi:glutamyl-tRNA synthetase
MSVRVRFAPSPTGHLHIGGARTALYNLLFAQKMTGTFILRIEDTDQDRSTTESEAGLIRDLKWLNLNWHEGPEVGGDYGPYRQSERLDLYHHHALELIKKRKAYYCFCSKELLDEKKSKAQALNLPPHYDQTCRYLSDSEVEKKLQAKEPASIRLKCIEENMKFTDLVRGEVEFPSDMVGDFIIMRSGGFPVYNFCCVVDDWLMKISHVIRAEEHLNNTCRQLMLYQAFDAHPPQFAHVSLLIGKDRQKLSKRHGATSVTMYREQSYLPEALNNYLVLLGWSHPEEKDILTLAEMAAVFSLNRFNKAPATFDLEKLNHVNGQHLKKYSSEEIVKMANAFLPLDSFFHQQKDDWKLEFIKLVREKISKVSEFEEYVKRIFSEMVLPGSDSPELLEVKNVLSWDTAATVKKYFGKKLENFRASGIEFVSATQFKEMLEELKSGHNIKGKNLFMGSRVALTGEVHGPDLQILIPLTPIKILIQRIQSLEGQA